MPTLFMFFTFVFIWNDLLMTQLSLICH